MTRPDEEVLEPAPASVAAPGPEVEIDWGELELGCALYKLGQVRETLPALAENRATRSVERKLRTILKGEL